MLHQSVVNFFFSSLYSFFRPNSLKILPKKRYSVEITAFFSGHFSNAQVEKVAHNALKLQEKNRTSDFHPLFFLVMLHV